MFRSLPNSIDDFWPCSEASPHAGYAPPHRVWRRLTSAVRAGIVAIAEWHSLRRAHRGLQCFDDRMLKDIGVSRSGIGRVVRYGRHH